jgi:hypothetical protein
MRARRHGHLVGAPVETTQVAPFEAVRIEHTRALPGIRHG